MGGGGFAGWFLIKIYILTILFVTSIKKLELDKANILRIKTSDGKANITKKTVSLIVYKIKVL